MNIKEIAEENNLFEKFLEDYRSENKPLALYGAGSYCDWVLRLLRRYNIIPNCIIDKANYVGGGKNVTFQLFHCRMRKCYIGKNRSRY